MCWSWYAPLDRDRARGPTWLNREWTNHQTYADLAAAKSSIFQYVEMFNNRKRIHQALGYMTPEQYETVHAPESDVA